LYKLDFKVNFDSKIKENLTVLKNGDFTDVTVNHGQSKQYRVRYNLVAPKGQIIIVVNIFFFIFSNIIDFKSFNYSKTVYNTYKLNFIVYAHNLHMP